jgi:hypothetical protein
VVAGADLPSPLPETFVEPGVRGPSGRTQANPRLRGDDSATILGGRRKGVTPGVVVGLIVIRDNHPREGQQS